MRIYIFLICTVAFGFTSDNVFSQNVNVVIDTDRVVTVDEVFDLIMRQTDCTFMYQVDMFKDAPVVTLKKGVIKAGDLLQLGLSHGRYALELVGDKIILVKPGTVGETTSFDIFQQNEVSGRVTDASGLPMAGVAVVVKGTGRGAITDFDGKYNIAVSEGSVLVFSYIGYHNQEVVVEEGQTEINVQLKENVTTLDEVVLVSTGYQTISKERATGSFSSVERAQLEKPASSIAERLVGAIPGLQSTVNADGSIDFEIRGKSSLYSNAQPLIVYDGFAIEGGLETINPNDVESITVLKDAAAASIWGAKSANGVIVITSKKGVKGKPRISVSSFVKTSGKLDLDYVNPVATSEEVINYEQKGFDSDFFGGPWPPPSATVSALGAQSLAITAMNEVRLGRLSPEARDAELNRLRGLNNKGQIRDYLLQSPITQQYNVSVSGGSERMSNRLSLMFETGKSYYKGDESKRVLINYGNTLNVTNWLDFNFQGTFQYDRGKNNGVDLAFIQSLQPYDMLRNADGSLIDMSYLNYYRPNLEAFVPMGLFPYADWSYNPISEVQSRDLRMERLNSRFQAGLTFKIIEGLTLNSKIQFELFNSSNKNYYSEESFAVRQFINETSSWNQDFNTAPTQNVPYGGILQQDKTTVKTYNFRNQLTFVRTFAEKHAINFIAGSEIQDRVMEFIGNPDAFGYSDQTLTTGELLNPAKGATMWDGSPMSYVPYFYDFSIFSTHAFSYNTDRFFSLYGNLSYTFDDKYTITGSYRTDASNLISEDPKYRYSPFWSVGAGWQLGREHFMEDADWLDRLNIRLTYGVNGNVNTSTSFQPLIGINGTLNQYTQETTAIMDDYGNPTLRWEKAKSANFGLDFSLFQGKLYGSVDYYNKKSIDLMVQQSIAAVNGTASQTFNNGEMSNKGFELKLGTTLPIKGNNIVWRGSVNYSYNKNRITKLYRASYQMYDLYDGGTTSYVDGYNANTLWSLRYAGLTNVGTESDPDLQPSFHGAGGDKLTFQNWPVGDAREYISNEGTTVAPSTFGMMHSFEIYDFDFSFIVTAKFGHVFRRQGFNYSPMAGGNTRVNSSYREVLNSDPSQRVPIPEEDYRYYFWDRFFPYLNYLTADASHIRFQEVSLGYSLPKKVTSKLGIDTMRFFAQANNLGVIFFNDYDEDPEYPMGTVKPQSTFTFGVNLNF
ncbi:SusC/RagA family TonB-linked outer membrane protein [Sinomicrobium sp.]